MVVLMYANIVMYVASFGVFIVYDVLLGNLISIPYFGGKIKENLLTFGIANSCPKKGDTPLLK